MNKSASKKTAFKKVISTQQQLYVKEVERLIKRRADKDEIGKIRNAFRRRRGASEVATSLSRVNESVDRQNDLA